MHFETLDSTNIYYLLIICVFIYFANIYKHDFYYSCFFNNV